MHENWFTVATLDSFAEPGTKSLKKARSHDPCTKFQDLHVDSALNTSLKAIPLLKKGASVCFKTSKRLAEVTASLQNVLKLNV